MLLAYFNQPCRIAAVTSTDQRRRDVDVSHDADRVDVGPRRIYRETEGVQQPARRLRRNSHQDRGQSPSRFLPARRYSSAGTSPVSVSITSRCSIETVERIGLVFATGASFHLSCTVF